MAITKLQPFNLDTTANYTFANVTASNVNGANLVSANYVTGTLTTATQPNITSTGTLVNLTVSGNIAFSGANVSLGAVGNLKITGGSANYVLQTDGAGNLSWVAVSSGSSSNISNGNSNVNIPSSNGNINLTAVGNTTMVVTGTGVNVAGTLNVSGNATVGNIVTSGSGGNVSNVNVISANTFIASGNITANNINTTGSGGNIGNANVISANTFTASGNITAGNANLGNAVTANYFIGNFYGTANSATTAGTVTTAAQPNITSVGTLTGLTSTGTADLTGASNVALGPVANVHITGGSNGQYLQTDGSGTLTWSTVSSGSTSNISNGNSNVNIPAANGNVNISAVGNANILVVTGTGVNVAGTLNVSGNTTVSNLISSGTGGNISNANVISANTFIASGNITANNINTTGSGGNIGNANVISANTFIASGNITAGNANLGNATTANYFIGNFYGTANLATFATTANAVAGGNVSGQVANSLIAGTVYTAAQPNITSVGTLTSLDVTGNITSGNANLGNLVTANFFSGNGSLLTGITVSAGNSIVNGNSNVSVVANGNITMSSAGNANIVIVTGTGMNIAGTLNATGNTTLGNLVTSGSGGNISNANVISGNTFIASGNITAGNITTGAGTGGNITGANVISANIVTATISANLGNSVTANFFIGSGANLTSLPAGNISGQVANSLIAGTVYTNAQPNITSTGTLVNLTVSGNVALSGANVSLGAVGNLKITGGTANYVLQTDGAGNLSWAAGASGSNISNGNSNVNIPAANGNVNISSAGNANILIITGTGANITGYANVSGNLSVGNITTGGGTGGNITGANVISANIVTATLSANLGNSVTANYFIGSGANLTSLPAGNISGQVANALISGTVYTNAQPNITSVGTLSSLAVTGNITSGNANLGNNVSANFFTGNGVYLTGITTAGLSNGNSNVNIPSSNGNVNISAVGNANILVVTGTGANVNGTLNVTGNTTVANLSTSGSGGNISNVNVISANTFIASGNITATNINTTGSGGNIGNANVISANTFTASGNITAGNANLGNSVTANYFTGNFYGTANLATYATTANAVAGGNVSGQVGNSLVAGTVYTAAQPNITSVGTLTSLVVSGTGSFGANVNLNSFNITSLATPVASTDAATKQYVDDVAQGLNIHDAAAAATPDTLANVTSGTVTYNNGSSGVGANLTTTGSFNLIDGVNVQTSGTRILVKSEANAVYNGIYIWSNATVITRATDYNSVPEVEAGDFVFVTGGTLYDNTGWVQTSTVSAIGTVGNNIEFTQFSGAGTYTAGTGLTLTGTTFSVSNTAVTSGSYGNGDSVATFTVNGQGQLTAAANVAITANAANLTGTTLNASIVTSSLTSVGTLTGLTSNGIVNFANTSNVTLGAVGNLKITGGTNAYVLQTDGTGNLSWVAQSAGSGVSNISNGNSNVSIATANGNITFSAVGTANVMTITGTGANINGTANITGNVALSGANVSLGAVGNLHVTGGTNAYVLSTDGVGNLSWVAQLGTSIGVDNFTGNGVQTAYTLSTTPANANATLVSIAGTFQPRTVYSVAGNVITFSSAPPNTAPIEVTTFTSGGGGGGGGGITAQDLLSPFLLMGS